MALLRNSFDKAQEGLFAPTTEVLRIQSKSCSLQDELFPVVMLRPNFERARTCHVVHAEKGKGVQTT